ncbi:lysylphosphatidylglycerol synthase domain-containing protein [Uniformispora flossi]|uniref:lysylphosphatidylglycerol synthase domain-containing protein n=1 Tax=Uniformispora flossi TaxID=3390723 RepID=UPI003C30DFD7
MTGPAADPAATPATGPASEPPAPDASAPAADAAAPRPPRPPWQRVLARLMVVARPVLLVLAVGGIVYIVLGNWDEVAKTLDELPWYSVACSGFVLLVGMFVGTLSWQQLVDGMGKPIGVLKGAQIQLVSQLGKYVPGSVWTYVLQLELGRKAQVSRARIFTASLLYVIISVVTALLLGVLALPVVLKDAPGAAWAFLLLPIGFAGLHPKVLARTGEFTLRLLKRPPVKLRLTWGLVGRSAGLASFAYVLFGVHLWILARGVAPADLQQLLLCIGAIAVGLTAGVFAFVLPSGAGVREIVLVAALATTMPRGQAVALALVSRILFTVADLVSAGIAALLARHVLKDPADPTATDRADAIAHKATRVDPEPEPHADPEPHPEPDPERGPRPDAAPDPAPDERGTR